MDKEDDEDKAIKQELGTSETKPNDDNRGKQEEERQQRNKKAMMIPANQKITL